MCICICLHCCLYLTVLPCLHLSLCFLSPPSPMEPPSPVWHPPPPLILFRLERFQSKIQILLHPTPSTNHCTTPHFLHLERLSRRLLLIFAVCSFVDWEVSIYDENIGPWKVFLSHWKTTRRASRFKLLSKYPIRCWFWWEYFVANDPFDAEWWNTFCTFSRWLCLLTMLVGIREVSLIVQLSRKWRFWKYFTAVQEHFKLKIYESSIAM